MIEKHAVFGEYITLGPWERRGVDATLYYEVMCTCGKIKWTQGNHLKHNTFGCKSCAARANQITHNLSRTPEYHIWLLMKYRCYNKEDSFYHRYGGRGISICEEWLASFENFYNDMGQRPSNKHSIDRVDNNGPYNKNNCRWATAREQANNKRNNKEVTFKGVRMTMAQWERQLGLKKGTIHQRLKAGQTIGRVMANRDLRRKSC